MLTTAKLIVSCVIGNVLEFYDFVLYGVFATVIAQVFFTSEDPHVNLLATFTVLAVGYFARPIGGILFGHFGDKYSRKKTLIASLLLMGLVTTAMGFLPSYADVGIAATILLVSFRLAQGVTVGGESAGSMVLLLESANQRWPAFISIFSLVGAVAGVLLALFVSKAVSYYFTPAAMLAGAWRIPFLVSAFLALIGVYLRVRFWSVEVLEPVKIPLKELFSVQKWQVISAVLFLCFPAVYTGFLFVYLIPFLIGHLQYTLAQALQVDIWVMLCMLASLLLGAFLSDCLRCHRLWLMLGFLLVAICVFPLVHLLIMGGGDTLLAILIFTVLGSLAMGAEVVYFVRLFKPAVRYSGAGFAHGFAFSFITGLTPLLLGYLILQFGLMAIAWLMLCAALISTLAICLSGTHD